MNISLYLYFNLIIVQNAFELASFFWFWVPFLSSLCVSNKSCQHGESLSVHFKSYKVTYISDWLCCSGNLVMIHASSKTTFWYIAALYWGMHFRTPPVSTDTYWNREIEKNSITSIYVIYLYDKLHQYKMSGLLDSSCAVTVHCLFMRWSLR